GGLRAGAVAASPDGTTRIDGRARRLAPRPRRPERPPAGARPPRPLARGPSARGERGSLRLAVAEERGVAAGGGGALHAAGLRQDDVQLEHLALALALHVQGDLIEVDLLV